MTSEARVQQIMRGWTVMDLEAMSGCSNPRAAMMAYLALMGFYSTELFGFLTWPEDERRGLLDDIRAIYGSFGPGKG